MFPFKKGDDDLLGTRVTERIILGRFQKSDFQVYDSVFILQGGWKGTWKIGISPQRALPVF